MHHFVWCIAGHDIMVHYGICWTGLLSEYVYANIFDNIFGMTDYVNISVIDILVSKNCI